MIRYSLRCAGAHDFESWFQSATAYDALAGRGMVTCPECGSAEVEKALMAPRVSTEREAPAAPKKADPRLDALARMRAKFEKEADWVGKRFATEARAIHSGDAPERPIWGEATPKEARALAEDGLPVAPLPFGPREKSN